MNITLDPDLEEQLRTAAEARGEDLEHYVRGVLFETLRREPPDVSADVEEEDPDALARAVAKMTSRTPEEKAAARARAIETLKPRTPPPPGTNGMQLVYGQWPGEETDEEIRAALDALS